MRVRGQATLYWALLSSGYFPGDTMGLSLPPGGGKWVWQARVLPILWVPGTPNSYPDNIWRRVGLRHRAVAVVGRIRTQPWVDSGSSDPVLKPHELGRLQTENSCFMEHRILLQPVSVLSGGEWSPAQVRKRFDYSWEALTVLVTDPRSLEDVPAERWFILLARSAGASAAESMSSGQWFPQSLRKFLIQFFSVSELFPRRRVFQTTLVSALKVEKRLSKPGDREVSARKPWEQAGREQSPVHGRRSG